MIVIISNSAVAEIQDTPEAIQLHNLIRHSCSGRHIILFDGDDAIKKWLNTTDIGSKTSYESGINLSLRSATIRASNRIAIKSKGEAAINPGCFSLDEALRLLDEPLAFVLENSANDWDFFLCSLNSNFRQKVKQAKDNRWLEPIHGGGSELPNKLKDRWSDRIKKMRTFAMFDSDRRHIDELSGSWAPVGQEACQGYVSQRFSETYFPEQHYMLKRRFIESYMPIAYLRKIAEETSCPFTVDAVDVFSRFNNEQQKYFNMKSGFSGDSKPENAHRCKDLYDDISIEDKKTIKDGFTSKLANNYKAIHELNTEINWDEETIAEFRLAYDKLISLL